jgi:hypothetical protein
LALALLLLIELPSQKSHIGLLRTSNKGAPVPGTLGYALNAFNATGAFLTDHIPGTSFDINALSADDSKTCPIDHFGNFK